MLKNKIRALLKRGFIRIYGWFNKIEKKVVFESFSGRQYSDNPKAVSEKMHELYPDYKLVWGLNREQDDFETVPSYIEVVSPRSISYMKHLATTFCYIQNEAMSATLYKRKKQFFIQTWHGDRGVKKILYDARADKGIKGHAIADDKLTDLFIVGSDYAEKRVESAFRYHGECLKKGMPRNDKLIKPSDVALVKERLKIDPDIKVLLYAPTLRANSKVVKGLIDIDETIKRLEAKGEKWICLLRAHPKSVGLDVKHSTNVVDVSKYPDMADLLMVSDMLITDYSSCAGDFILKYKPVILVHFDLEQYMKEDRTFFVDINEVGFLITKNQEELNTLIDTLGDEDYAENCKKVLNYFGTKETGNSAEEICKIIDERYHGLFPQH